MKKATILVVLLAGVVALSFVESDNGKAGRTGSPGESDCTSCHNGTVNTGPGSVTITAPTMTNWQYSPGQVYPISVTVAQTSRSLFGLGFEALKSDGSNGGTLAITNTSQTQIKTATISGKSRNNVVHQLNGGASANTHTFTFNWTAPTSTTGTVTFYTAGVAANGNGSESGDYVYKTSQAVTPITTSLNEAENNYFLNVGPNPVHDRMNVSYSLDSNVPVEISLINMEGKVVDQLISEKQAAGQHQINYDIPSSLQKGIYMVELNVNNSPKFKKIIVI